MCSYDLNRLKLELGVETLRELQEELLLRPTGTTFHERFLRHLATLGVWMSPLPEDQSSQDPTPLTLTYIHTKAF